MIHQHCLGQASNILHTIVALPLRIFRFASVLQLDTCNADIIRVLSDEIDMCPATIYGLLPTFCWGWIANWKESATISWGVLYGFYTAVGQMVMAHPFRFGGDDCGVLPSLQLMRRRHCLFKTKQKQYHEEIRRILITPVIHPSNTESGKTNRVRQANESNSNDNDNTMILQLKHYTK